jgi:hypothetical protein
MSSEDPDLVKYLNTLKEQGVQVTDKIIQLWQKRKIAPAQVQPSKFSIKRSGQEDYIVPVVDLQR